MRAFKRRNAPKCRDSQRVVSVPIAAEFGRHFDRHISCSFDYFCGERLEARTNLALCNLCGVFRSSLRVLSHDFRPRRTAKKSANTSIRLGLGPPGGVTQCTAPVGRDQLGSTISSSFALSASLTINSGSRPIPVPAMSDGNSASPLFTRSGPTGRTLAVSPDLLRKRQVSCVSWYA